MGVLLCVLWFVLWDVRGFGLLDGSGLRGRLARLRRRLCLLGFRLCGRVRLRRGRRVCGFACRVFGVRLQVCGVRERLCGLCLRLLAFARRVNGCCLRRRADLLLLCRVKARRAGVDGSFRVVGACSFLSALRGSARGVGLLLRLFLRLRFLPILLLLVRHVLVGVLLELVAPFLADGVAVFLRVAEFAVGVEHALNGVGVVYVRAVAPVVDEARNHLAAFGVVAVDVKGGLLVQEVRAAGRSARAAKAAFWKAVCRELRFQSFGIVAEVVREVAAVFEGGSEFVNGSRVPDAVFFVCVEVLRGIVDVVFIAVEMAIGAVALLDAAIVVVIHGEPARKVARLPCHLRPDELRGDARALRNRHGDVAIREIGDIDGAARARACIAKRALEPAEVEMVARTCIMEEHFLKGSRVLEILLNLLCLLRRRAVWENDVHGIAAVAIVDVVGMLRAADFCIVLRRACRRRNDAVETELIVQDAANLRQDVCPARFEVLHLLRDGVALRRHVVRACVEICARTLLRLRFLRLCDRKRGLCRRLLRRLRLCAVMSELRLRRGFCLRDEVFRAVCRIVSTPADATDEC